MSRRGKPFHGRVAVGQKKNEQGGGGDFTVLDFPRGSDIDPIETREWLDALDTVLEHEGPERLHFILDRLSARARELGVAIPFNANTP